MINIIFDENEETVAFLHITENKMKVFIDSQSEAFFIKSPTHTSIKNALSVDISLNKKEIKYKVI